MANYGGAGNCATCSHPDRWELEFRLLRGDTYQTIADLVGVTNAAVRNHVESGHVQINVANFRKWMQSNGPAPLKDVEKRKQSFLEKVLAQPQEITQQMVSATLLLCANEAHEILQLMRDKDDYRGSIGAIEALRRTTMDLSALHSLKSDGKAEEVIDSADVANLRSSILEAVQAKMGDTPGIINHRPLR